MKTSQQFCESVYHKYALELERRHEKQHVRLLLVQRSAAAAAVVTVAVGTSVFVFRPKDGKLPVGPGTSISDSTNPVKQTVISAQTMGLIVDTAPFFLDVPPAGQVQYSSTLNAAFAAETDDAALFRLALTFHGSEAEVRAAREALEAKGLPVEDACFDIMENCVVTVSRDEISELANDAIGTRARLAPAARPEGYDRRLGDLAASWLDTAEETDSIRVLIYTAWNSKADVPNADLFLEDDLVALVGDRVPLPKPKASTYEEASSPDFLAKMQQWLQNNEAIENLGNSYLTQQLDALSTRIGITDKIGQTAMFGIPGGDSDDALLNEDTFTWEGNLYTIATIEAAVTKAQLQQLAQDNGVRYIQVIFDDGYVLL